LSFASLSRTILCMSESMSEQTPLISSVQFQTTGIRAFNPETQLVESHEGAVYPFHNANGLVDVRERFWGNSLGPNDILVSGFTFGESGLTPYDFAVLRYTFHSGEMVLAGQVMKEPTKFLTEQLAQRLAAVPLSELVKLQTEDFDPAWIAAKGKELYS